MLQKIIKNQKKIAQSVSKMRPGGTLEAFWVDFEASWRTWTIFWRGGVPKSAPSLLKIARSIDVERVVGAFWCVLGALGVVLETSRRYLEAS